MPKSDSLTSSYVEQIELEKSATRQAERAEQRKGTLPFTRPTKLGSQAYIRELEKAKTKVETEVLRQQAKTVKLDTGERVDKEAFEKLTSEQQAQLKSLGIDEFNKQQVAKTEAEISKAVVTTPDLTNAIAVGAGEYMSVSDYNALTSEQQQQVKALGVTGYNNLMKAQAQAVAPQVVAPRDLPQGITKEQIQDLQVNAALLSQKADSLAASLSTSKNIPSAFFDWVSGKVPSDIPQETLEQYIDIEESLADSDEWARYFAAVKGSQTAKSYSDFFKTYTTDYANKEFTAIPSSQDVDAVIASTMPIVIDATKAGETYLAPSIDYMAAIKAGLPEAKLEAIGIPQATISAAKVAVAEQAKIQPYIKDGSIDLWGALLGGVTAQELKNNTSLKTNEELIAAIGGDAQTAYDYSISAGNSPDVALDYAINYVKSLYTTTGYTSAQATIPIYVLPEAYTSEYLTKETARLRALPETDPSHLSEGQMIVGVSGDGKGGLLYTIYTPPPTKTPTGKPSDAEAMLGGATTVIPVVNYAPSISDAELVVGATVDATLFNYYKSNPKLIDDSSIAQRLVSAGYALSDVTTARVAANQIIKAEKQQEALNKIQNSLDAIYGIQTTRDRTADAETIKTTATIITPKINSKTGDVELFATSRVITATRDLTNYLQANPIDGAQTLLDAGYSKPAVLLLSWDTYKSNPQELKAALNNAGFSDAEISDYAKAVIQELKTPAMPEYEATPSLRDYVSDYLRSIGKPYLESEIKANIMGMFAIGAGEISLDKDIQTAIAQYTDKYGLGEMLQSGAATTTALGFEPAREFQPGRSIADDFKSVSSAQWAIGAAQLLTMVALPLGGTVVGKVLTYAGQAAFGVSIAAEWDDMTTAQRATSLALLIVSALPDITSAIPKDSLIGKAINKDLTARISQTAGDIKAYVDDNPDAYVAYKFKELQEAVVKGDASAIKTITDDMNTYGMAAKVRGVMGADEIIETAKYFNKHADDIARNIIDIRESSLALPQSLKDVYTELREVVDKQRLSAMRAQGIKEPVITEEPILSEDVSIVRDPITSRVLESPVIDKLSNIIARDEGLLSDVVSFEDITSKTVIRNGAETTVKDAARSINESIGNTVKSQGWAAAEDTFGRELMEAYNPKAALFAATDRNIALSQLPANIVSKAEAKLNTLEFTREALDDRGILSGARATTEIKGLVDADGAPIAGFTVRDAFSELDDLTKSGKATYIEQPGGFIKVTPTGDVSGFKYITEDGIYVSPKVIESLPAYKDGLIRITGESYFAKESLEQIFKPTSAAEINTSVVESITDNAYTTTEAGYRYVLSADELARYTGADIYLDIPASALNEASTIKVSGVNIGDVASKISEDIKNIKINSGIMPAIAKYGVALVARVYPIAVSQIIAATQARVLTDVASQFTVVQPSIWDKIKQQAAEVVVSASLIAQLGLGAVQPIQIVQPTAIEMSNILSAEVPQVEAQTIASNYVRLNTNEYALKSDYDALNNIQKAQINNIGISRFNTISGTDIISQAIPTTIAATIPQAIPQAVPETIPETVPQTIPQTMPYTMFETIPQTIPQTMPYTIPETIPATIPQTIPQTIPETIPIQIQKTITTETPKPVPPPTIMPKGGSKEEEKERKRKEFEGAITFKHGIMYRAWKYPYENDEEDLASFWKYPPPGALIIPNAKTAQGTLQLYLGNTPPPPDRVMHMGIVDFSIHSTPDGKLEIKAVENREAASGYDDWLNDHPRGAHTHKVSKSRVKEATASTDTGEDDFAVRSA